MHCRVNSVETQRTSQTKTLHSLLSVQITRSVQKNKSNRKRAEVVWSYGLVYTEDGQGGECNFQGQLLPCELLQDIRICKIFCSFRVLSSLPCVFWENTSEFALFHVTREEERVLTVYFAFIWIFFFQLFFFPF